MNEMKKNLQMISAVFLRHRHDISTELRDLKINKNPTDEENQWKIHKS